MTWWIVPSPRFLSTLSLRRATADVVPVQHCREDFYPRSPCGERLLILPSRFTRSAFLSTLSLRRATAFQKLMAALLQFLSTLSLRRATDIHLSKILPRPISIHALLAESDQPRSRKTDRPQPFLSTLSLRRATKLIAYQSGLLRDFYPRSPCGERQPGEHHANSQQENFYPRSPCGERL